MVGLFRGVTILYLSGLYANIDEDITSFPAVTDETGRYQFTYDQAPATEHTLYARYHHPFLILNILGKLILLL